MKLTELKSTVTPPFQRAGRFWLFSHGLERWEEFSQSLVPYVPKCQNQSC